MRYAATLAILTLVAILSPVTVSAQPPTPIGSTLARLGSGPSMIALRRTGPFCSPSFNAIKLQLDDQYASWYFTGFLNSDPAGPFVRRYLPASYAPAPLPPDVSGTGMARHVPGKYPAGDGVSDMRLHLTCVRYSRRFGGSVQLLFRDEDTYEYDARQGSTLWDLDDVELSVFVVPTSGQFNTGVASIGTERTYVELHPRTLLAYTIDSTGKIASNADSQSSAFKVLWSNVSAGISSPAHSPNAFRYPVGAFVYGFVHYLWSSDLVATNRVSMIELDENALDLETVMGTPWVDVALRIANIDLREGTLQTGTTLTLRATATWDPALTFQHTFDLEDRTSTSITSFFRFKLSACPSTGSPAVTVTGTYRESFPWGDNTSSIGSNIVPINCTQLQAAATNGAWGTKASNELAFAETDSSGAHVGSLNIVVITSLQNR